MLKEEKAEPLNDCVINKWNANTDVHSVTCIDMVFCFKKQSSICS